MNGTSRHWAEQNERGNRLFLKLTAVIVRYFPPLLMKPCIWFVVLYFYLTSPGARKNLHTYQNRLRHTFPDAMPSENRIFAQFLAFGEAVCDRFAVWQRKIRYEDLIIEDPDNLTASMYQNGRGQVFACSHLGNTEICRALVSHHRNFKLNVLVHSRHAQMFNEALQQAGADKIQLIQVSDLDASLMMTLNRRIEAGEWLAVAADRIPVRGEKTVTVDFLQHRTEIPQGAWILASLLKTKVNALFCIKQDGRYRLKLFPMTDTSDWTRAERTQKIKESAQHFARILEEECRLNPLQWFNFYDFWHTEHHPR